MGLITKTFYATALGLTGATSYLALTTSIIQPLPKDDPIWTSRAYKKYNGYKNPATQDICIKRIPIEKIRPELLQREGDLVTEFSRGIWSGWGYHVQRIYLTNKYKGPETSKQLWKRPELSDADYNVSTQITDHFEVVDRTPTEITVRAGDTPRNAGPRDSDGLFVISAKVDKAAGLVELGLKSVFFTSASKADGTAGPMPWWIENLHQWYSRIWMASGSSRLLR